VHLLQPFEPSRPGLFKKITTDALKPGLAGFDSRPVCCLICGDRSRRTFAYDGCDRGLDRETADANARCCLRAGIVRCAGRPVRSETLPLIPKWERFEQAFVSSILYGNPLQQATLTVSFTSPLGERIVVCGFWDGGKVWRVRFTPDQPDAVLHHRVFRPVEQGSGAPNRSILCTAPRAKPVPPTWPGKHRPRRRHFEHRDGTPFFWLADSTWDGARLSNPKDWETYARIRAAQNSPRSVGCHPGCGCGRRAGICRQRAGCRQSEFFKRLDAKVDALNRRGC